MPKGSWIARAGNLLLALGATLACLAVLELGIRIFPPAPHFAPIPHYDVDPDNRLRYLPNQERTLETNEYRYTVRYNSFGRRDVEWPPATLADPRNIVFVGDSFVFGNSVDDEDSVPTLLEGWLARRGDPREVFNFGRGGTGPPTYKLLLEDALASGIRAGTVVVGVFVGNDFYPSTLWGPVIELERKAGEPPTKRPPRSELLHFVKTRLASSPRVVSWALDLSGRLGISLYDTAGSYIFLRRPTPDQTRVFQSILDILGTVGDLAHEHDREFAMVLFPNRIQVENGPDLTNSVLDAAVPNARILEYCRSRGIPCLDLLPVLSERYDRGGEPLYFPIDRHLNATGSRVAAEAIGAFLEESGVLSR